MSVVWEDPPPGAPRGTRFGREASPLRKEANALMETLELNPGRWARLWDFETQEDARKRASFAAKKGFNMSVRKTDHGYSVFSRYVGIKPDEPETAQDEPVREPSFPA